MKTPRLHETKEHWTISLRDAHVEGPRASPHPKAKPTRWREGDVEAALAIAPQILGLADATPFIRSGTKNNNAKAPDQLYVDPIGRVHVVEIKDEKSTGASAIAQALSYGEALRMTPRAVLDQFQGWIEQRQTLAACLSDFRALAASKHTGGLSEPPRPASERLAQFPLGLAPRHIIIAPSFDDSAGQFVRELSLRGTSIELVELALSCTPDEVALEVTRRSRPFIEQTWAAFRALWPRVFDVTEFVGWAEPVHSEVFSLALKRAPHVRFGLLIDDRLGTGRDEVWLSWWKPDHDGPAGNETMRSFREGAGHELRPTEVSGRDFYWQLTTGGTSGHLDVDLAARVIAHVDGHYAA